MPQGDRRDSMRKLMESAMLCGKAGAAPAAPLYSPAQSYSIKSFSSVLPGFSRYSLTQRGWRPRPVHCCAGLAGSW